MRRLLLLCLLFVPVIALAQEDRIEMGETLTVSVTSSSSTVMDFTLDANSYVTVQAVSTLDEIDPVVWVIDSQNRVRAYNDNQGESPSAKLDNLYLEAGEYQLFVDSFNGVSDGDVDVSLQIVDPNDSYIEISDRQIVITGYLLEDSVYRYVLVDVSDTPITITVRDMSGDLDPILTVLKQDGQVIAQNDDHGSLDTSLNTFDARIINIIRNDNDTIIIEVNDFLGRAGAFEIVVSAGS